jgi:23S rRNA (cytosine1962-C5)-methyltransferase
VFQDEHLLVTLKPAGWNTHAPAPHAVDGLYDWLRRSRQWSSLAIVHRLDKETSGLLVFGRSPAANKGLTAAFTERRVQKEYTLLTSRDALEATVAGTRGAVTATRQDDGWVRVTSHIARRGDTYSCVAPGAGSQEAVTLFRLTRSGRGSFEVAARPLTGRTHQIRVHAAALGMPILGDVAYGGDPTWRLFLHASKLAFAHPVTGEAMEFADALLDAPGNGARFGIQQAMLRADDTDIVRLVHGAPDGAGGRTHVDLLGDTVLIQSERDPAGAEAHAWLGTQTLGGPPVRRVLAKRLRRDVRVAGAAEDMSPRHVAGEPGEATFRVRENGVLFELRLAEGYSVGLFHDQRQNRRALLHNFLGPDFGTILPPCAGELRPEVLNLFSYTCGFSVCAALAGARATSLDLSRKYLAWGGANFEHNGVDPAQHDFIYGDAFDWLGRFARKGRTFDAVMLDPPTFSTSGKGARFSAERDFGALAAAALGVLKPGGVLFCSTNAARLSPDAFLASVEDAVAVAGRRITSRQFLTQPPDFAGPAGEAAYLKSVWCRID